MKYYRQIAVDISCVMVEVLLAMVFDLEDSVVAHLGYFRSSVRGSMTINPPTARLVRSTIIY